jgi:hypothetical protein
MDSKRLLTTALAAFALLTGSLAAAADEPATFQADLTAIAERIAATRGSDDETVRAVARRIESLPPEALATLEERMERMPGWRALPDVLAELDRKALEQEHRVASRAVSRLQAPTEAEEMETFRADLLLFVDRLATYEPLVADPAGFAARLDALRQQVHAIPTDQLHHLKSGFERNAPIWQRALSSPGAGQPTGLGSKGLDLTIDFEGIDCSFGCGSACDLDCGKCCEPGPPLCNPVCLACEGTEEICKLGCEAAELVCGGLNDAISDVVGVINQITGFLDDFFEDIEGVFTEIAGLPGDIEEFFLGIFSDLESHLLSIVSTLAGPGLSLVLRRLDAALGQPVGPGSRIAGHRADHADARQRPLIGAQPRIVLGGVARIDAGVGVAEQHRGIANPPRFPGQVGEAIVQRRAVDDRAVVAGVQAGMQAGPRRPARAGHGVVTPEQGAAGRQLVQRRRAHHRMPDRAQAIGAPLVGGDQ